MLPFFQILDLFHRGIFSVLNDECKFQHPSMQNFVSNLKSACQKNETAITWNFSGPKSENTFLIRHFSSDVRYSTVCHIILKKENSFVSFYFSNKILK